MPSCVSAMPGSGTERYGTGAGRECIRCSDGRGAGSAVPAPPASARPMLPITSARTAPTSRKRSSVLAGCTFTSSSSGGRSSHSATTGWRPDGDHLAIGDAHRALQHRIGDRPAVHRQRLRRRGGAGHRRRAGIAGDAQRAALARDLHHRVGRLGAEQRRDAVGAILRRQVEDDTAVAFQAERHRGCGQRQAAHHRLGVLRLGARMLEELAPRRRGEEQVAHHDTRARRAGGGRDIGHLAALDARLSEACAASRGREVMARRAAAPIEGSASPRKPRVAMCTRSSSASFEVAWRSTASARPSASMPHAIVGHLDAVDAAGVEGDGDARGAGVERVLHQLLHRRRRALDHLAGGDAVDGVRREDADRWHALWSRSEVRTQSVHGAHAKSHGSTRLSENSIGAGGIGESRAA